MSISFPVNFSFYFKEWFQGEFKSFLGINLYNSLVMVWNSLLIKSLNLIF